jgi:hypothetical protein
LKTGDPLDQPIDQPLPDPPGRWIIAIAPGQPAFFLLKPDAKIVKAARIPAPAAIQSACLVAGHFYVATKDPARLIELDLAAESRCNRGTRRPSPPVSRSSLPPARPTFPIGALNLKTGNAVSTGKDGQTVIGHPAERYLFTATDQGAQARTLLLDVVHVDVGQTELSLLSLRLLAKLLIASKQLVPAAHCVAVASGLDRADPATRNLAAEVFPPSA